VHRNLPRASGYSSSRIEIAAYLLDFSHAWHNVSMTQTAKAWLKGLGVAVISAAAGVIAGFALASDPHEYKLVLQLAAFDAIKAAAAYLKRSPLPGVEEGK